MRKQIVKAATMFVGIIALAFVSAVVSSAQNSHSMTVNIPFDFTVKGKSLPAGEYIISQSSAADSTGLKIQRRDGSGNAIVLSRSIQNGERQRESKLVFNRYGEQYFLSQVWTLGNTEGRELYKTNRERSLEIELARANTRAETVVLVTRAQ